uniref:Uncharacterized protein n=1 Tax=Strigamia maritima TaxID=126957 RepID=T1JD54_STRMM
MTPSFFDNLTLAEYCLSR